MIGKTLPHRDAIAVRPNVLLQFFVPFETVVGRFSDMVSHGSRRFSDWFQLEGELSRLRKENEEFRVRQLTLDEVRLENVRLRRLLRFKESHDDMDDVFSARVVGRNPGHWFESVVIDRGSRSGVAEGMVAI